MKYFNVNIVVETSDNQTDVDVFDRLDNWAWELDARFVGTVTETEKPKGMFDE